MYWTENTKYEVPVMQDIFCGGVGNCFLLFSSQTLFYMHLYPFFDEKLLCHTLSTLLDGQKRSLFVLLHTFFLTLNPTVSKKFSNEVMHDGSAAKMLKVKERAVEWQRRVE